MSPDVNYLAVFLAAVSSMIVGAVWYMPQVFGKTWSSLTKVKIENMGADPAKAYGLTFAASLLTAFVLAHMSFITNRFYGNSFMYDALMTAFWLWIGFTATRLLVHDLFENRPTKLTVLNSTHELITLLVMAMVIGLLKP